MKNEMIKKTGLRTAGKAFAIIDIIIACLLILGTVALFVVSTIITKKVIASGHPEAAEAIQWQTFADSLFTWGIVCAVASPLMLAFSIVGLKLCQKSMNFVAMLIFGIVNIIIGGAPILGILMICIACIECYKKH